MSPVTPNSELLRKSYGFSLPQASTENSIESLVAQGKVVGEWKDGFKVHRNDPAARHLSVSEEQIQNVWQALDYFCEGELDVFACEGSFFFFPQEGRNLLNGIRKIVEQKDEKADPVFVSNPSFDSNDPFLINLQGKLLTLEGNFTDAGKAFGKALSLLPEYSEPYANLGTLLWKMEQKKEAFVMFVEALLRNPHNVAAQLNFFDAGRELGEFGNMVKVIEELLNRAPECNEYYPILAFSYFRLGQREKSISILKDFLQKNPGEEEAKLLLDHIQSQGA